jgi:hypothetical protein
VQLSYFIDFSRTERALVAIGFEHLDNSPLANFVRSSLLVIIVIHLVAIVCNTAAKLIDEQILILPTVISSKLISISRTATTDISGHPVRTEFKILRFSLSHSIGLTGIDKFVSEDIPINLFHSSKMASIFVLEFLAFKIASGDNTPSRSFKNSISSKVSLELKV